MEIDESVDHSASELSEDEDDEKIENEIHILEEKISANLYDYSSHVGLIKLLKESADLNRLRVARTRMAENFPLSTDLWLSWVQDEQRIATSEEEKKNLVNLFEKALKDYLSVEIWLEYAQFSIGIMDNLDGGMEKVRAVFERALTAAGLHVTKGALLWEAYTEFEIVVLSMLQGQCEQEPQKSAYETQLKRIANLFKRQLSCPLYDMDETKERFSMWLQDNVTSEMDIIDRHVVENFYKKAKEKLKKIEPFEEKLISDPQNLLKNYNHYLEHEKSKDGTPPRVTCLYERAVADNNLCLEPSLWLDYIEYVDVTLNSESVLELCSRAIRNCPWSVQIFQYYIRGLEKYHKSHEIIKGAMEQALTSGFQFPTDYRDMWLCYLEYMRRRYDDRDIDKEEEGKRCEELRSSFERALNHLSELGDGDPENAVAQYWARIEAIYCKNMEKSRNLWSDIMREEKNNTAALWLEYVNLERLYGDSKHLRKLFPRALTYTRDWPESIGNAWLNYERDEGTLESYMTCVSKFKARMKQIAEIREKEENKQIHQEQVIRRPKRAGLGFTEEKKKNERNYKEEKKSIVGYKRKIDTDIKGTPPKKEKIESLISQNEKSEDIVEKLLQEKQKETVHGVTVAHDSSKDNRTVFVSNLDFETEESLIRDVFSKIGTITDLRLVKDFKGRSKGFCYVEFQTQVEAKEALKKDREMVNGRPMFVSKCDPDKETRGSGFKFSTRLEKNKLFVKGLPHTTTEEELREMFGKYGALKDVRLVTFRNGHSKGLAYIDFEDEVSAAQAIIKTDGTKIGDREIKVAISNPPARKTELYSSQSEVQSLGGGPKETGPRGRGRTQVSFVPRSLQLQHTATNSIANLSIASPSSTSDTEKKQLSNSQFRDLLLSKK